MSQKMLVTFNAGSSTVKIGLFALDQGKAQRIGKGMIDFRKAPLRFELSEGPDRFDVELKARPGGELDEVLGEAFERLSWHYDLDDVAAIGHRVVHGGDLFTGPVAVDGESLARMEELVALAPLHQPQALKLIYAIARLQPGIKQTASFDTAFHRTNTEIVQRFALPRELHDQGIRRYGFHGLSYKFIAAELARRDAKAASGKVVAAHLGSGASLCGLDNGISRDTSMGFSTLDGVPMATRCGALDAGVLLHLMGAGGRTLDDVEDILYNRSGLLGLSGISADSRVLLESDRPQAREAIEVFAFRIAGEIARLAATLGGLDAIVFTAGVGEHQPAVRADICKRLEWLGVDIDRIANEANATSISSGRSRVSVFVIPTDEEQVIADEALSIANGARP